MNILIQRANQINNYRELLGFHTANKYLYFCYDIASNNTPETIKQYIKVLNELLSKEVTNGKIQNSFFHMAGYLKESSQYPTVIQAIKTKDLEKAFNLLKIIAVELNQSYLLNQTILKEGYPR